MTREVHMMKCGCAASGTDSEGKPVCVSHIGLMIEDGKDLARVIDEPPDLTGRKARCGYGAHADVPSKLTLPFFKYRPEADMDEYYCGCFGWD